MLGFFRLIGGGDAFKGKQYSVIAFLAIVGVIIILCGIAIYRNSEERRKSSGVKLKSAEAKKRKAKRRKGVFNYDIINDGKSKGQATHIPARVNDNVEELKKALADTSEVDDYVPAAPRHAPAARTDDGKSRSMPRMSLKSKSSNPHVSLRSAGAGQPQQRIQPMPTPAPAPAPDATTAPASTYQPAPATIPEFDPMEPQSDAPARTGRHAMHAAQVPPANPPMTRIQPPPAPRLRHATPASGDATGGASPFDDGNPFANVIDPEQMEGR